VPHLQKDRQDYEMARRIPIKVDENMKKNMTGYPEADFAHITSELSHFILLLQNYGNSFDRLTYKPKIPVDTQVERMKELQDFVISMLKKEEEEETTTTASYYYPNQDKKKKKVGAV
jgi:hypothetical protein